MNQRTPCASTGEFFNTIRQIRTLARLFDQLVGAQQDRRWHFETKRLRGLKVDDKFDAERGQDSGPIHNSATLTARLPRRAQLVMQAWVFAFAFTHCQSRHPMQRQRNVSIDLGTESMPELGSGTKRRASVMRAPPWPAVLRAATSRAGPRHIRGSAAASSAFLGHALPLDDKDPEARSPITEKFYSVTQRMPLKTLAMKAWSEAVLSAYLKAGGVWPPRPYEAPVKKSYRTKNWRKLGIDFVRISIPNGAPPRIKPRTLI
jgi:hypothetical protein